MQEAKASGEKPMLEEGVRTIGVESSAGFSLSQEWVNRVERDGILLARLFVRAQRVLLDGQDRVSICECTDQPHTQIFEDASSMSSWVGWWCAAAHD